MNTDKAARIIIEYLSIMPVSFYTVQCIHGKEADDPLTQPS